MIMIRMHTQKDTCARQRRDCGTKIVRKLEENRFCATYCQVIWNDDTRYKAMNKSENVVDVFKRNCTCRSWQLIDIPFPYANSTINHRQDDAYDYVDEYYKMTKFLVACQNKIQPVCREKFWKKTNREALEPLLVWANSSRCKQKRTIEECGVAHGIRMS